jgi:two-component system response regulator MprA
MDARKALQLLLVEDEPRTAKVLARMLREDGYHVEVAGDGAVAIGRLSRPPLPDVLIADVRLPHVDGIGVAKYARSLDPEMPIILTTSYLQQALLAERDMRPPPVIFAKPYDYKRLEAEIERLVYSMPGGQMER